MMPKMRFIWIMVLCNLFFLGVLMGVIFIKHHQQISNYQGKGTIQSKKIIDTYNIKSLAFQLKQTINLTGQTLHQRWSQLFHKAKSKTKPEYLTFKSWLNTQFANIYQRISSIKLGPSTTKNNQQSLFNANHQTTNFAYPSPGNHFNLTPSPLITPLPTPTVEVDPFLTLVAKLQPKETPKIEDKLTVIAKPQIEEKPTTTPTPKIEPTPMVEQKTKIDDKSITGKESDKTSPKNLGKYHLRGIVIGQSPVAYIEGPNGYQKLIVGDEVDTGKIVHITDSSVTIQFENEQFVLNVE